MASIRDALEESLQDSLAWLKYFVYTIPAFFVINTVIEGKNPAWLTALVIFSILLYLGFMLNCTYNVRMGKNTVLPNFNVFSVLWSGIKCFIALAPLAIIGYFASAKIIEILPNYIPESVVLNIFNYAIIAIFASFALTGYLLYIKKFNLFDAYNVKLIFKYAMDVMIATLFMFFLLAIVDAIIVAPLTYILWLFMGIPNPVAVYLWCMIGLLNIAMAGHYLAQIDYDVIPVNDDEDDIVNRTINDERK